MLLAAYKNKIGTKLLWKENAPIEGKSSRKRNTAQVGLKERCSKNHPANRMVSP
jgi:hypothetical protein